MPKKRKKRTRKAKKRSAVSKAAKTQHRVGKSNRLRIGYLVLGSSAHDFPVLQRRLLIAKGESWQLAPEEFAEDISFASFFDELDHTVEMLRSHHESGFSVYGDLEIISRLACGDKLYLNVDGQLFQIPPRPCAPPQITITQEAAEFRLKVQIADSELDPNKILLIHKSAILYHDYSVWPIPYDVPELLVDAINKWSEGKANSQVLARLITAPGLDEYLIVRRDVASVATSLRPIPVLRLSQHSLWPPQSRLSAAICFRYQSSEINADSTNDTCDVHPRQLLVEAEHRATIDAHRCVVRDSFANGYMANTKTLLPVLAELRDAGWIIESMGESVHTASSIKCSVRSRVDWFDLEANLDFGGACLDLLSAIARFKAGERLIQLKDGSFALLPADLLERFATVAEFADEVDGVLRFPRTHVALLDALLAAQYISFDADAAYKKASAGLRGQVGPAEPLAEFAGTLRPYQSQGLSWLNRMRDIGFGGCLADDMGLGKTVQVIAHLQALAATTPHLIVVPRSVLENWRREAERFWPRCDVYVHHGTGRSKEQLEAKHDLIVTTYGTLRSDVADFATLAIDTCVLDEAQLVKNPGTHAAKSVRLVQARQRLALTGTPIENHLGDLWSIFEFLNPGMLGASSRFRALIDNPRAAAGSATLQTISAAMRPFILRRTKAQVLTDLPDKTESTLYCELEGEQLREYQLRRDHIRADLLGLVKRDGLTSKIKVIEALLRLRQCACHVGLVSKELASVPSAKLTVLLDQLREVISEGHKALVFSQFTSFLAFAKSALDDSGITYEYLDGSTLDRQARVDRFNSDPDCPVFLISLKAGGLGLNLTSASYVYILDPWWNPAAESQAIDRAHRFGQTDKVFAYRLIARNTVEEKVLELQSCKRELADAILTADKSLLRKLDVGELQLLLS